jgi:phosphatidylinositol alpha-mannosyltransferase
LATAQFLDKIIKNMRVGLISFHSFNKPGGVKRHILGLQKEFKRRGIYSKIIAPRRKKQEFYGKDVILLGTSFPLSFSGSQSDFCINFNPLAIERVLKKEKFDVLHFHNFGFPSVWQILERSEAHNVLTFHANIEGSEFLKNFPIFLYLLNKIVQWKIDGVIGVAPLNIKVFKDFKGSKAVIPNAIDLGEFNPQVLKIKKFSDDKINLLFLGRIEERKGLIYLLKAYQILEKKFTNLRLIVVGKGPLKNELQNWVKKNKLKNVVFEGEVKERHTPPYYKTCDIFVSPAIYGESFGIVLVEAMACGKPVVAFANEGYKEVLEKGKGGRFLVKPRDYKTLAQKLEILIKNEELRKEMGEWGLKEAQNYSWPKITDQVLDFYELCRKKKGEKNKKIISLNNILGKTYTKDFFNWLKKLR